MSFKSYLCVVSLSFAMCLEARAADARLPQLTRQGGTDTLHGVVDLTHGVLRWTHGALVYRDTGTQPPSFYALDREGSLISSLTVNIPGAELISGGDFDRGSDGSMVLSGIAHSGGGQPAAFLAWISADGQSERVVRTGSYRANMVAIAPDGSVWTIGYEMAMLATESSPVNRADGALRHFDRTGKLLGTALPQSQFGTPEEKARLASGFLVAKPDRLGWYGPNFGVTGRYVEISTDTMRVQEFPRLPRGYTSDNLLIERLALTDGKQVIVGVLDRGPRPARVTYIYDRGAAKWDVVGTPRLASNPAYPALLLGSDDENLVFQAERSVAFFSIPPR